MYYIIRRKFFNAILIEYCITKIDFTHIWTVSKKIKRIFLFCKTKVSTSTMKIQDFLNLFWEVLIFHFENRWDDYKYRLKILIILLSLLILSSISLLFYWEIFCFSLSLSLNLKFNSQIHIWNFNVITINDII